MADKKQGKKVRRQKESEAVRSLDPVWRTLLELFASCDDVFTEAGAFDPEHIHKSLGRLYRAWLDARETLDPDFDREKYRHDMKQHSKSQVRRTPLGRKLPVSGSQKSSMARTSISGKKRKTPGETERNTAKKSAQGVKSGKRASTGRSKREKSGVSGAGSHTESEVGSGSGLRKRATPRSPKGKG